MADTDKPKIEKVDLLKLPPLPKGEEMPKEVKQKLRRIRELLKVNKEARRAAQAMLNGYQLQQWGAYALRHLELPFESAALIVEYVKIFAIQTFLEEPMRDSLRDDTLPFVSERMLEHAKNRTREAAKKEEAKEKEAEE